MTTPNIPATVVNAQSQSTLLFGGQGSNAVPMLLVNLDPVNAVWIGNSSNVIYGQSPGVPLIAGASMAINGAISWYGVANGTPVEVAIIPNGTSYFLPASLTNIGGSKVYVQTGTPTGTIPLNSIWFNTSTKSLETWNGSAWVNEQFNAQNLIVAATILGTQIASQTISASNVANGTLTTAQIAAAAGILGTQIAGATITSANIAANTIVASNIAANTITASQLAAGIIYAGIVNGTTITGAQFIADGSSGEVLVYSGTPASGNLIASISAVAGTDSHSNNYYDGFDVYHGTGRLLAHVNTVQNEPAIDMYTGVVSEQGQASLYNLAVNVGLVNEYMNTWLAGPASTWDGNSADIVLVSSQKNGAAAGGGLLDYGGKTQLQWLGSGVRVLDTSGNPYDVARLTLVTPNEDNQNITSTSNTPITNLNAPVIANGSYKISAVIQWNAEQAAGKAIFNFTSPTLSNAWLSAIFAENNTGTYFTGMQPTALGIVESNTMQTAQTMTTWLDGYAQFEAAGTLTLCASVGTSGDDFVILNAMMTIEPIIV